MYEKLKKTGIIYREKYRWILRAVLTICTAFLLCGCIFRPAKHESPIIWEDPLLEEDGVTGEYQSSYNAFAGEGHVFLFEAKYNNYASSNWALARRILKKRLDAIQSPYVLGSLYGREDTIAVLVSGAAMGLTEEECLSNIGMSIRNIMCDFSSLQLRAGAGFFSLEPGDGSISSVRKDDRTVLSLDMSQGNKDILNRLTLKNPPGTVLALCLNGTPVFGTVVKEPVPDGILELEKDLYFGSDFIKSDSEGLISFLNEILSGERIPVSLSGMDICYIKNAEGELSESVYKGDLEGAFPEALIKGCKDLIRNCSDRDYEVHIEKIEKLSTAWNMTLGLTLPEDREFPQALMDTVKDLYQSVSFERSWLNHVYIRILAPGEKYHPYGVFFFTKYTDTNDTLIPIVHGNFLGDLYGKYAEELEREIYQDPFFNERQHAGYEWQFDVKREEDLVTDHYH